MIDPFRFSPDVEAFRAEVVAFLDEALADAAAHRDASDLTGLDEGFERELQRAAGARGWLDLEGDRRAVFEFEVARRDAPLVDTAMTLAGPAVERYGTPAQHERLLAPMRRGEVELCIAYTESGAGSDLGALQATGRADGDGWVLDGRKVLVTGAHKADWCCTVVRTDPDAPRRSAMTMFLLDMRSPGVRVERTPTMNGWDLADVVLDGVRVPGDAVLGEVGAGWAQLTGAVASERLRCFWLGSARRLLDLLVELVRGGPLAEDPIALDTLGRCWLAYADAARLTRRALRDDAAGALPSMVKVATTELLQALAAAGLELAGEAGVAWAPLHTPDPLRDGRLGWEHLERVHGTISVGANEVQRDLVAQLALGLPRAR